MDGWLTQFHPNGADPQTMNSRYEIQNQLGEGGEATVWKAWDTKLQRFVALKILLPPSMRETPDAGDIMAEASALSALQHPNIVSVFDVEEDAETGPYVVMEFLNGENLEQTVQRGALTPEDFISITNQILEGLVAAHKLGMQHRDIKPSNLMLTWLPDNRFIAKLLDFGLAKFSVRPRQQTVKVNQKILGSIYFMAPEQFSRRPLDYRSDLYSLGCVLYYALTTRHPFAGETSAQIMQSHLDHMVAPLRDIRPEVPPILCDWVMWLIRRQPEHRPKDADQALEIFRAAVNGEITELPQNITGLRTTTVMQTRKTPAPHAAATSEMGARAKEERSSGVVPYVLGGMLLGLAGAGAWAKQQGQWPFSEGPSSVVIFSSLPSPKPNAPVLQWPPVPPVNAGLAIWLDAEAGVMTAGGHRDALPGESVDAWLDLDAANSGQTDFLVPKDPAGQPPVLQEITDAAGLSGRHRVLRFSGAQSLLASQREVSVPLVAGNLEAPQFTIFCVARMDNKPANHPRLLSAKCGEEKLAWDISFEVDRVVGGVRLLDGAPSKTGVPGDFSEAFSLVEFTRDGASDKATISAILGAGARVVADPVPAKQIHGPLNALRIGAISDFSEGRSEYFNGDLAILLIYQRVLPEEERAAVEGYLLKRFMNR